MSQCHVTDRSEVDRLICAGKLKHREKFSDAITASCYFEKQWGRRWYDVIRFGNVNRAELFTIPKHVREKLVQLNLKAQHKLYVKKT